MPSERIEFNLSTPEKYDECCVCRKISKQEEYFKSTLNIKVNSLNCSVTKLNIKCLEYKSCFPEIMMETTATAQISPDLRDKYLKEKPARITIRETKFVNCPHHLAARKKKSS